MNIQENKVDFFDRFLRNELVEDERAVFEQKLQNDTSFKIEWEAYQKAVQVVNLMGLRAQLENLMEANQKPKQIVAHWYVWVPMAAAVVLMIGYFWPSQSASDRELFISYYKAYPNVITTRSTSNELTSALSEYSSQHYLEANQLLAAISPATDTVYFYRGLVNLSLSKSDSAISNLSKITPGSVFQQQANWYLALAHLSKSDRLNAISYLLKIKSSQFNFESAQKILVEVGKKK